VSFGKTICVIIERLSFGVFNSAMVFSLIFLKVKKAV